jgi:indole-3-glycerol phosphate synthase
MSDVLDRICADKRAHIADCQRLTPLASLEARARGTPAPRGFALTLERRAAADGFGLICEIKKASPSKGLIRSDFDPAHLAGAYRDGGAACLSVLTDVPYFQGSDAHLQAARQAVDLPILRKDFTLDPYQVVEARALGADAVLLIMAALSDAQARELAAAAATWDLDVLVEVHDAAELDRAARIDSSLIGINNRNLKTLGVNLETTRHLAPRVPRGRLTVCESGLSTPDDLAGMARVGARAFLIGESLMRRDDVAWATHALRRDAMAMLGAGEPTADPAPTNPAPTNPATANPATANPAPANPTTA